ncbi:transporter [Aquabacterium sp. A7-Y]|uniref:SphA family protein n=1 Tax=Aquabacterium sp. A7-Y TaxID=1349605 RepID=UPI00223E278A|nr:transporter [Aquabacterium sp. A7-Y]MCW7541651.1 transporter [Aquabacterium sp. A7-Y]
MTLSRPVLLAAVSAAVTFSSSALATENGQVRALLGGPGQELTSPQFPGWYGQVWLQHYRATKVRDNDGNSNVATLDGQQLRVRPKIEATVVVPRLTYISELRYLEGRVGASVSLPIVHQRNEVSFPGGTVSDSKSGIGDTEMAAFLDWQTDDYRLVTSLGLVAPTGDYDEDRAVNPGAGNFWTVRPGVVASYVWENGFEVGSRTTYSFNTRNRDTDVRSGQYLHSDVSGLYRLNDTTRLGLQGFVLRQTTDDSGPDVASHGNKVQSLGLGPLVGYTSEDGRWAVEFKVLREFSVRNRPEGTISYLRLQMRLD